MEDGQVEKARQEIVEEWSGMAKSEEQRRKA